ncbi:MAG: hypothetical protein ACTHU0_21840 [Kofleriaceae bacterium]
MEHAARIPGADRSRGGPANDIDEDELETAFFERTKISPTPPRPDAAPAPAPSASKPGPQPMPSGPPVIITIKMPEPLCKSTAAEYQRVASFYDEMTCKKLRAQGFPAAVLVHPHYLKVEVHGAVNAPMAAEDAEPASDDPQPIPWLAHLDRVPFLVWIIAVITCASVAITLARLGAHPLWAMLFLALLSLIVPFIRSAIR